MQYTHITDKGILRSNNEDNCRAEKVFDFTILALADGMGGANCGEVASEEAIAAVFESLDESFLRHLERVEIPRSLIRVTEKANKRIFLLAKEYPEYNGMGTTLDFCLVFKNSVYISHTGDSRVYKISPSGEILQLTKDHSLVEYMIDTGAITRDQAKTHPQKNIITKALGTDAYIEPDIISHTLEDKDFILMCSDGLTNMVNDEDILSTVLSSDTLENAAQKLVAMANDAGGTDNITVVIAQNKD